MVIFGETNTDGKGSAADLNQDNGFAIGYEQWQYAGTAYFMHDNFTFEGGNIAASIQNIALNFALNVTNHANWNSAGVKELLITDGSLYNEGEFSHIQVHGFVDVHIHTSEIINWLPESQVLEIDIAQAKRGDIDVSGVSNDVDIDITPYSNGESWSNMFTVASGEGNDRVAFAATDTATASSSRWTEFSVSLGGGDDTFIYAIHAANDAAMTRIVDGGDGFDTLELSRDTSDLTFSDFERVTSTASTGVSLTLDSELLASNTSEFGLILDDVSISFTDDYTSIGVDDVSAAQSDYLSEHDLDSSEFAAVTITYGEDSYTLLTNQVSDAWS